MKPIQTSPDDIARAKPLRAPEAARGTSHSSRAIRIGCGLLTVAAPVAGQTDPYGELPAQAPSDSTIAPSASPSTEAASPSPPVSDYVCAPECRSGFVCVQRQCISACNPLCRAGEICTNEGACISACNPPCRVGELCTAQGQCTAPAPAPDPRAQPGWAPAQPGPYGPGAAWPGHAGPPPDRPIPDGGPRQTGKRFHDGFYFRMGLGAGALMALTKATEDDVDPRYDEVGATGVTIPVELAFGGTPAPGLVIGGGSYAVHVPSAKYTTGRGDYVIEEDADYGSISMIGPFIDIYLDPQAGAHFQVAPCLTFVTVGNSDNIATGNNSGFGFGAMAGLGYEGWVSDQWGLGLLARVQYLKVELEAEDGARSEVSALVPSALLTATLH